MSGTDPSSEHVSEWQFDRYRNGQLKAQGVTVHTATAAEAWEKARSLLYIDGNRPSDELRTKWDACEGSRDGERCGRPVYGYVERRCCDGRECGCMGKPIDPCWCDECWKKWEQHSKSIPEPPCLT